MKFASLLLFVSVPLLPIAACDSRDRLPADGSIPGWLRQHVSDGGQFPPAIEQVTYKGQPAYHIIATDRFDTGDEHSLFSEEGKLICRFGGVAGQVTSGSCELDKIVYVSTLYDPDRG